MIIDLHVHISACTPPNGYMSRRLLGSLGFRFMRWSLGLRGTDAATDKALESALADTIDQTPQLDAAVVLAFDAVYDAEGNYDKTNTHLYVSNDYVMELAARHPKMLFGASVHPYRKDAVQELERCVRGGAKLVKWLPNTQKINPADPHCTAFYEALDHYHIPLLCHTGGEQSLPCVDDSLGDPGLLRGALDRGVTVIAAHCATHSRPREIDHLPRLLSLMRHYENLYGDTAALNLPFRWYAYRQILKDKDIAAKLVHGSDWPILPVPPLRGVGAGKWLKLIRRPNWIERDLLIKRQLGFDDAYWRRGAKLLGLAS